MVLLTSKEVAKRLGWAETTVRKKRMSGDGPKFLKMGRSVRYTEADLDAYIEASRRRSTCEVAS